jgi:hypothetical protein
MVQCHKNNKIKLYLAIIFALQISDDGTFRFEDLIGIRLNEVFREGCLIFISSSLLDVDEVKMEPVESIFLFCSFSDTFRHDSLDFVDVIGIDGSMFDDKMEPVESRFWFCSFSDTFRHDSIDFVDVIGIDGSMFDDKMEPVESRFWFCSFSDTFRHDSIDFVDVEGIDDSMIEVIDDSSFNIDFLKDNRRDEHLDVNSDDKLELELEENRVWIGGLMVTFPLETVDIREVVCETGLTFKLDPWNAIGSAPLDCCKPETDMFEGQLFFGGFADTSNCVKLVRDFLFTCKL